MNLKRLIITNLPILRENKQYFVVRSNGKHYTVTCRLPVSSARAKTGSQAPSNIKWGPERLKTRKAYAKKAPHQKGLI